MSLRRVCLLLYSILLFAVSRLVLVSLLTLLFPFFILSFFPAIHRHVLVSSHSTLYLSPSFFVYQNMDFPSVIIRHFSRASGY